MDQKQLAEEIRRHRKLYYNETPEISDGDFDNLVGQMREIDPNDPVLKEVGAPIEDGKVKVTHSRIMGSLDVVNNEDEWRRWNDKHQTYQPKIIVAEPKLDGLTIVLTYKNGKFVRGATRGDGEVGELIVHAEKMTGVLKELTHPVDIEVRGEGVVKRVDAEKEGAANPRNLATGLTKRKNGQGIEMIHFIPFQLVNGGTYKDELEELERMKELGFPEVVEYFPHPGSGVVEAFNYFEARRPDYDYDMDGVVLKYNSKQIQEELGETEYSPKWAVAWKFKSDKGLTRVTGISCKTGRTGRVVPVLHVEAIKLAGATCVNVTANNFGFIKDNEIGIGTELILERAGDVIPHVVEVTKPVGECIIPETCPTCNTALWWDGPNLICKSNECEGKTSALIQNWIWGTGIEWFGPAAQKSLAEAGLLKGIPDIYTISLEDYKRVVGSAMGTKIYCSIQEKKDMDWWRFLMALGVKHLGYKIAKELAKRWKTIPDIISFLEQTPIEGMGVIKNRIIKELSDRSSEILKVLSEVTITYPEEKEVMQGKLQGSFCVTGTLSKPRKQIHKLIEENGGTIASGVSKGLDYLVAGEKAGSKLDKARSLGVKVISEQELMGMIKDQQ